MTALSADQRRHYDDVTSQLHQTVEEVKELPDGYAFRYPSNAEMLLKVAEFVTLERLCCPFLAFGIDVQPGESSLWLSLTGRDGVKEFIREEFGLSG